MRKRFDKSKGKAKTRQEIAFEYGIDRKTFYRWIKRSKITITNGLIFPAEMELIYKTFGEPYPVNNHKDRNSQNPE